MKTLLTRDEFRQRVFERDNHQCVVCKEPVQDAHHIIERRLFNDGGYYVDNGASVCGNHHWMAEQTVLTCEKLRELAGITTVVLPDHLYEDTRYDKWGNVILPSQERLRGELYYDISFQRILKTYKGLRDSFTHYVKYPRTFHLPWSEEVKKDDRTLQNVDYFVGREIVVTMKMDGENTNLYRDKIHARSLDSRNHPSRNWVKNLHSQIAHDIPDQWRICGENLFAEHSIAYKNLPSFFMVFSIWNEKNECLSWDETEEYASLLGLNMVPLLYKGIWDEELIKGLYGPTSKSFDYSDELEGYVVRWANSFPFSQFRRAMAKFVRHGHVQTHGHWMEKLIKNQMTQE